MTPEGKVKEQIKKILREYEVYYHMPVQNGMGTPTLDFICCFHGRYLAIEAKAPGKKPTVRQHKTMADISTAGGACMVMDGSEEHLYFLRNWFNAVLAMEKLEART